MKMNRVEKALMNNPIRAFFQRNLEVPLLEKLGGRVDGLKVLEVGCGRGVGTEQILTRLGALKVHAMDVDPDMVRLARVRMAAYSPEQWHVSEGDVTHIQAEDASYDAVFDFAILHHVPHWQDGVAEIFRVLKPGGRFFFEEVTRHFLEKWFARSFLVHPVENRFSGQEFVGELEKKKILVGSNWVERWGGDYVFGVGRKS
jgi:ubiquinone/menaquinone biosynthesis C-methylase UbiE